ncbi:hypothetical protein GCM10022198_19250 [Klugiella xanthotipulae]|uniref:Uncharacterized protein Ymh n=1 Tax=Klugiella xanthotipulae TaxID=244735 RepID=A0A543HS42_9MICO|nr:TIGR02391 family protein [Klugiella xanthotipulae]TQM61125.1 uncharacterized protein Ymh [Klugiella xanthotipulae]
MKPERAIIELRNLNDCAASDPAVQADTPANKEWKAKVQAVLQQSLGSDSTIVEDFSKLKYSMGFWTGAPGEDEIHAEFFRSRMRDACSIIDAAIYVLEIAVGPSAADSTQYDSGLWSHVRHSVIEERWEQVPSAACIYVEHKVRQWAGNPVGSDGKKLVGHSLFTKALNSGGPLALGSQPNETDGWRNLGTGLIAAIGNVDRHGIQDRNDVKKYALGVLGLSSLLLSQIKLQHSDLMDQNDKQK